MQKVWSITNQRAAGFSVVEVLLAATVFGFLVTALVGALVYGRQATADAGDHARATLLAEEGLEAARNIGNANYANLTNGTFGLGQSAGQWIFSGSSDTAGGYTRTVTIADAGTERKAITSTVTWAQQGGGTGTVTLTSRLTNWLAAVVIPTTWPNAVLGASANITGSNNAVKVAISGNYAYVVLNATSNNFAIINITDPAAPVISSTITIAGTPTNITVSGNYAYVTNMSDTGEFQVVEITTPTAPVLRRTVDFAGTANPNSVAILGTNAFVARDGSSTTSSNEFTVVNISNPLTAAVSGGYNNNIAMNGIYLAGNNYAYVSTGSSSAEMLVINITTPTSPTLAFTYNATGTTVAQTVDGFGTTVLLGRGSTMEALNIATPTSPSLISVFTAVSTVNKIDVHSAQQYAFLATSSTTAEFQVVNIANLASMSSARTVDVPGTTSTMTGLAYSTTSDVVVGATASDTQEVVIFRKN